MKASDIVLQLASRLPSLTEYFTSNFTVISITRSGTVVTVETDVDHSFVVGDGVFINGAETPLEISSFTRVGTIGTITTSADHDITLGSVDSADVQGSAESEFNGSFLISSVPNRRTLLVEMEDSGPTSSGGSPLLTNGSSCLQSYNGLKQVTSVPTTTTFQYSISDTTLLDPVGNISARGKVRVSSAISIDRVIDSYTEQEIDQLWMFVVLGDTSASRDRNIRSDAVSNTQRSQYFRQQLVQQVSIYVLFPSTSQVAGRSSRDLAEELLKPICQSILFKRFSTYLTEDKYNPLQFVSHGFEAYNTAYYIHNYTFEQVADLTFGDTVGYDEDVAFRDIELDMGLNVGTETLTASIDLDEDPL